jgi:sugar O-acyltransferase (sialic acid O-acetyltransferase NeuD family)
MVDSVVHVVVLGGGGHAGVVIDALQLAGVSVRGILDPRPELHGTTIMEVLVLGGDDLLLKLKSEGVSSFVLGVGSVGRTPRRRRLFEDGLRSGLVPFTVIHPSATCSKWANLAAGTVVLANAVINANARIGVNVIINSGTIVEHGCSIGDHTHVASGARVLGDVQIGDEVFIGAGATVKQGITIGNGAVVGAGAVVLNDVAPDLTVAGVPARVVNPK